MAKKKPTASEIEKMYDSGENRVTQERNDFLLPQILDFVREKKWMNIRPEYQRRLVWDRRKKSLFIESLLMNIPVPPVFLYENDLNRYEVMDGQQRLNAILEFYDNTLVLTGLTSWNVLNGLTYAQCPPRIKSGLDRRRISANVLLADSVSSEGGGRLRRTVFERLNTGGQQLNAQELRNSLYSGSFNELLIELAGDTLFDQIWEIPPYEDHYRPTEGYISSTLTENKFFRRMTDCEIVLRFFGFRNISAIKGSVRSILDNCMAANRDAEEDKLQEWRAAFHNALETSHAIFGQRTFQVRDDKGRWNRSIPLFDAVMVGVDSLIAKRQRLVKNKKNIADDLARTLARKSTYEIIVGKPNTGKAIKKRISIVTRLLRRHS
jgi:Protein of unknown function DUF262